MGGGRKSKSKSKKSKAAKPKTKAQRMAVANKAKYGGTASAAKANKAAGKAKAKSYTKTSGAATAAANNKAAMKAKTKAKYTASQAAKKAAPSKGASISKGTTGIGPVSSGKTYSKAVSNATNAPTKKTTGIGPYADGAKYAAALKASPPKFADGTKIASGVTGYGLRPDGVTGEYKEGDVFNTGGKSGVDYKYQGVPGKGSFVPVKTAMLGGDNLGSILGTGAVIGAGMSLPGMIKNAIDAGGKLKQNIEKRVNPDADKISAIGNLTGLGIGAGAPSYFSIKSPESFGAPSQAAVDAAAGITAGGLNIGGGGFTPSNPSTTSRAISDGTSGVGPVADGGQYAKNVLQARFPGASPNSAIFGMDAAQLNQPGGPFAQPGPTPENTPEADYTSYQPGSYYNQSDTNMNPTNFLRSARNVVTTPARMLGINNRFTNMLIPKSNEAIQDARDQRGPRPTLTRPKSRGGARLPVAPLTPEEIIEGASVGQTVPDYQQAPIAQTGVDPNRLMQIQQEAYLQAYNPTFNPMFRFFDRRRGARRGAFRRAFRRD